MKFGRIWLVLALVIIAGAAVYIFLSSRGNTQTYDGTELSGEAQDFQLTDQNDALVSLSDFRGKVVVLTFMDTKCQDTCPLTAAHFREVYRELKPDEVSQVVFLGVNVNVEESTVEDVSEATHTWRLDEISSWHFLTGTHEVLEPVWKDYGAAAAHSLDGNSIMHTPGTFLIDQFGQKRWYISTPFSNEAVDLTLPLSELLLKRIHELLL
jgi:cytochrome oxidase Cu insertion factor (SCO1/SenC/PrrC family)